MARLLITGGSGFIGRNLAEQLAGDHEVMAPPRAELDLLDDQAVAAYLSRHAFDVVILGGRVVDGTGNAWFHGDVALRGDRIARVAPAGLLQGAAAKERIDAKGLVRWHDIGYEPFTDTAFVLSESKRLLALPAK